MPGLCDGRLEPGGANGVTDRDHDSTVTRFFYFNLQMLVGGQQSERSVSVDTQNDNTLARRSASDVCLFSVTARKDKLMAAFDCIRTQTPNTRTSSPRNDYPLRKRALAQRDFYCLGII